MKKIKNPWLGLTDKGYNCFGCSPENPYGLKMEFYEDGDDIVSFWTPGENYQGWMNTLHGGIQATLMDESAGWLIPDIGHDNQSEYKVQETYTHRKRCNT